MALYDRTQPCGHDVRMYAERTRMYGSVKYNTRRLGGAERWYGYSQSPCA